MTIIATLLALFAGLAAALLQHALLAGPWRRQPRQRLVRVRRAVAQEFMLRWGERKDEIVATQGRQWAEDIRAGRPLSRGFRQ